MNVYATKVDSSIFFFFLKKQTHTQGRENEVLTQKLYDRLFAWNLASFEFIFFRFSAIQANNPVFWIK